LIEVRYLLSQLFPIFKLPVTRNEVDREHVSQLFDIIRPELPKIWDKLYLREIFDKEEDGKVLDFELACYAKYLILAGYLASVNNPKNDIQYFSTAAVHTSKRKKHAGVAAPKDTGTMVGRRDFELHRLLAIFYSIIEDVSSHIPDVKDIYHQIATLTTLNFFSSVSTEINLDAVMKLRCNVSFEFIEALSLNVKFDLSKYLYTA